MSVGTAGSSFHVAAIFSPPTPLPIRFPADGWAWPSTGVAGAGAAAASQELMWGEGSDGGAGDPGHLHEPGRCPTQAPVNGIAWR